jgi:hypothetical protein
MVTIKQNKIIKLNLSENIRTKGELLRSAGYSETTSKRPSQVLESKGIQELQAQSQSIDGLDDKTLLQGISKAIKAQFTRNNADYALRWLQLLYSNKGYQDNRTLNSITINANDINDQALELVNTGLLNGKFEVIDGIVAKILSTTAKSTTPK